MRTLILADGVFEVVFERAVVSIIEERRMPGASVSDVALCKGNAAEFSQAGLEEEARGGVGVVGDDVRFRVPFHAVV